jgi:hypothetical protein
MRKIKGKFNLDFQSLEKIVKLLKDEYIKNGISFDIDTSKYSNSLYLYIQKEDTFISLRIANHNTRNKIHNHEIIVNNETTNSQIMEYIIKLCKKINIKRVRYLINKTSKREMK